MKTILSLGAGVQSSTLALMAAAGEITPIPDAAIFADTQAEPKSVYDWLYWLEKQLPFPVYRVTKGDMTAEMLRIRSRKKEPEEGNWAKSLIPAYVKNRDGSKGIMQRVCTYDYKIVQIEKKARELANIKRGEKGIKVIQWIGISLDEAHRMKPARRPWIKHKWPLIDAGMRRSDCLMWMEKHGYPKPPRSACIYCPFHSDYEWKRLKQEEPEEWDKAVKFEKDLQDVKEKTYNLKGRLYLHKSLVNLDCVDLSTPEENGQLDLFGNECAGICGV